MTTKKSTADKGPAAPAGVTLSPDEVSRIGALFDALGPARYKTGFGLVRPELLRAAITGRPTHPLVARLIRGALVTLEDWAQRHPAAKSEG